MKKLFTFGSLFALLSIFNPALAAQGALPQQAVDHMPVCPVALSNSVRCHAQVVVNRNGRPRTGPTPVAMTPDLLHSAYNLPALAAGTPIVGIVDAYDYPTALADLNTAAAKFNIPAMQACSGPVAASATPCFAKIDQNGGANYPSTVNGGWALEAALDIQTVHAICQNCSIVFVEANSTSLDDLMAALDQAVAQGAHIVSNSYGSSGEFSGETSYDTHFANRTGYAFTFSSGDSGYGTSYPAASSYVTSVGGTTLYTNSDGSYNSEKVWSGTGSGCSALEVKPTFQHDSACSKRTINDIAADADPSSGMSVYDSTPYNGSTGWFQVGGTSFASPIIAGVYALIGGVPSGVMGNAMIYGSTNLHDITSGSNGNCSSKRNTTTAYLCKALTGYDGPTGNGTPNAGL